MKNNKIKQEPTTEQNCNTEQQCQDEQIISVEQQCQNEQVILDAPEISVKNLVKIVYEAFNDIVAVCSHTNTSVRVHFPNGKDYLISVTELK